jgi:hypothetical protein
MHKDSTTLNRISPAFRFNSDLLSFILLWQEPIRVPICTLRYRFPPIHRIIPLQAFKHRLCMIFPALYTYTDKNVVGSLYNFGFRQKDFPSESCLIASSHAHRAGTSARCQMALLRKTFAAWSMLLALDCPHILRWLVGEKVVLEQLARYIFLGMHLPSINKWLRWTGDK